MYNTNSFVIRKRKTDRQKKRKKAKGKKGEKEKNKKKKVYSPKCKHTVLIN